MRRTQPNIAEKRVLLQSIEKKNSLRITYAKLNLEEKAFISSTKFDRRQLLSRQNRLRQLQSTAHRNRGIGCEIRPKTQTTFPDLPAGRNESVNQDYPSTLNLPLSKTGLRSSGKIRERRSVNSSLGNNLRSGKKYISRKSIDTRFKNVATLEDVVNEKKNEVPWKQEAKIVDKDLETKHTRGSGINFGDIIAYSDRYSKREKIKKEENAIKCDDMNMGNKILESNSKNRRSDLNFLPSNENGLFDITSSRMSQDKTSEKQWRRKDQVQDPLNYDARPRGQGSTSVKFELENKNETRFLATTESRLLRDVNANAKSKRKETNSVQEDKSGSKYSEETDGRNTSSSPLPRCQNEAHCDENDTRDDPERPGRSSSSVPILVSRNKSWNGTEDLPALGRIRRGSFCDVKTFTSGKVLELLSSCDVPSTENETSKQYLNVEDENLKYCRYLRSVTPEAIMNEDSESLEIPLKYRPSKHVIIGHTKMSPLL